MDLGLELAWEREIYIWAKKDVGRLGRAKEDVDRLRDGMYSSPGLRFSTRMTKIDVNPNTCSSFGILVLDSQRRLA